MPCLPLPPIPLALLRYPTATLLPDGRVLIMGGTVTPGGQDGNRDWELLNPTAMATTAYPLNKQYLRDTKKVGPARFQLLCAGILFHIRNLQ